MKLSASRLYFVLFRVMRVDRLSSSKTKIHEITRNDTKGTGEIQ
jgi:hypothetical protein